VNTIGSVTKGLKAGWAGAEAERSGQPTPMLRQIPGPFKQFSIITRRCLVQVFRNTKRRAIDIFVITASAFILSIQHRNASQEASNVVIFHLALCILVPVNCLSCFGSDRPIFWRERSHELHGIAYCLARMAVDSLDILLQSTIYVTVYYLIAQPPVPFQWYVLPCYCLALVCSGWGYIISTLVPPQNATMTTAVWMLVLNGAIGDPSNMGDYINGGFMEFMVSIAPTRWSVQMFFVNFWQQCDILPSEQGRRGD